MWLDTAHYNSAYSYNQKSHKLVYWTTIRLKVGDYMRYIDVLCTICKIYIIYTNCKMCKM